MRSVADPAIRRSPPAIDREKIIQGPAAMCEAVHTPQKSILQPDNHWFKREHQRRVQEIAHAITLPEVQDGKITARRLRLSFSRRETRYIGNTDRRQALAIAIFAASGGRLCVLYELGYSRLWQAARKFDVGGLVYPRMRPA